MTNKEIKDFTSKLVSLKNENSINKITIKTNERKLNELKEINQRLTDLLIEHENAEGLIINTLDNTELTDKEKIKIIKDNL